MIAFEANHEKHNHSCYTMIPDKPTSLKTKNDNSVKQFSNNQSKTSDSLIDIDRNEMKSKIMELMHRLGGDITLADMTSYILGFKDNSWKATTGYNKQTIRAETNWDVSISKSKVIIWEGHSKIAGKAITDLINNGMLKYKICSSKRYNNYKLKYPIIRRDSDARKEQDKLHWVPICFYISKSEMSRLESFYPAETEHIGDVKVEFFRDPDYPVRISKGLCTSSFFSACENGLIYDDDNGKEEELTDFEHNYLLTMKNEVSLWEEQFNED